MNYFNNIKCFTLIFLLFFSNNAIAEDDENTTKEVVATMETGDIAQFSGTLFSTSATARLIADLETTKALCKIETNRSLAIKKAEFDLEKRNLTATMNSLQYRCDQTIQIRDSQIDFLEKRVETPRLTKEMTFAIGVLSGVALTISSAYVIHLTINE
tara:strand:- start:427 stop:897 length:471 start_codon:yes stop_codon:yes gene_type:complete